METRQAELSEFMEKDRHDLRFEAPREYTQETFMELFADPHAKAPAHPKKQGYVRVTRNKSGEDRYCIRFGFVGTAAQEAEKHPYVMPSFIERDRNRIYFKFTDSKTNKYTFKLSRFSQESGKSAYFCITPGEKADRLYQTYYTGKSFPLHYDEVNECHYITIEEE